MSDREKIDYFFANLDSLLQKGYAPAEALVKCTSDYQFVFSLQSDAQKAMEAAATSYNNKRDEICAHFKSGFECGFQQKTNCGDKACIVRKHSPVL